MSSVKCSGCGANMVFDPNFQMMHCTYCGNLEAVVEEETEFPLSSEKQEDKDKSPLFYNFEKKEEKASQETFKQNASTTKQYYGTDAIEYICDNCGATIVTDQNTVATFCLFCGNSTIIAQRVKDSLRPDYVIPFSYSQTEAQKKFLTWFKKGLLAPSDFVATSNLEKITGLYIPCWLFDYRVDMDITATGSQTFESRMGDSIVKTTNYYDLIRKKKLLWEKVPFDGASHIDDEIVSIIEPYDYSELTGFNMKYLSGFLADKYDQDASEVQGQAEIKVRKYVQDTFKYSTDTFHHVKIEKDNSRYLPASPKYALMPVWFLNYHYRNKTYTFAMNGQSGKVYGKLPLSPVKTGAASFFSLAGFVLIFAMLVLLFSLIAGTDRFVRRENPINSDPIIMVKDQADLFSAGQEEKIYQKIRQQAIQQNLNIVVDTVATKGEQYSYGKLGSETYAADRYADLTNFNSAYDNSGYLFLIDMDYRYVYIYTFDQVASYVSNAKCTAITESISRYLTQGDYYGGTLQGLKDIQQTYSLNYPSYFGLFSFWQLVFVVIGSFVGSIFIMIFLVKQKSSKKTTTSNTYRVLIDNPEEKYVDNFKYSRESVTRVSSDSSSGGFGGGGGGGGSRSGGGGSRF